MSKRKYLKKYCLLCDEKSALENISFELTYHRFPAAPQTKKLWIDFCNLDEEKDDVSNVYICSLHFKKTDYSLTLNDQKIGGRLRLKRGAVPSILVPNKKDLSVTKETSPPSFQILESMAFTPKVTTISPLDCGSPNSDNITYIEDTICLTPKQYKEKSPNISTSRTEHRLMFALQKVERQRKKIRIITQRNRRLTKRVQSLQDLVKHLQKKVLISGKPV